MSQSRPGTAPSATKWWVLGVASILTFGNYYAYDAVAPLASSAFAFAVALWRREIGPHGHGLEFPR